MNSPQSSPHEVRLLELCARPKLDHSVISAADDLLDRGIGPESFFQLCLRNGLAPHAHRLLKVADGSSKLPSLLSRLRDRVLISTSNHMIATRDAVRATEVLKEAGVPSLVVKGPVLTALDETPLREYCDLDLLVRPEHALRARDVLLDSGYTQSSGPPTQLLRRHIPYGSELNLTAPGRITIDLHWHLTDPGYACSLPESEVWGRSQEVSLREGSVRTLSPEASLLYLCVHGTKHLWSRLIWIRDISAYLSAFPKLSWSKTLDLARETGCTRALALGLFLSSDLGAPAPSSLAPLLEDGAVAQLAREVSSWRGHQRPHGDRHSFLLRSRERKRDKLRYLLDITFRPTEHEWTDLDLPAGLYPLYGGYRTLRLVARYARGRGKP